ncbi:MAG: hypothetical protein D4R64_14470 [Porphyromonadaceae bacterium]|nr:MAG: hypothetical protein D4R64_14470 [Porphyromonadaceae bacterium]
MKGRDALTGQEFIKKVTTQRFSSRENQVRYNNKKANDKRRALNGYWKVLTRNRDILHRKLGDKAEQNVSRDFLIGAGYDFNYLTHSSIKAEDKVMGIFKFGLQPLSDDRYKVFRFRNRPVLDAESLNPPIL